MHYTDLLLDPRVEAVVDVKKDRVHNIVKVVLVEGLAWPRSNDRERQFSCIKHAIWDLGGMK